MMVNAGRALWKLVGTVKKALLQRIESSRPSSLWELQVVGCVGGFMGCVGGFMRCVGGLWDVSVVYGILWWSAMITFP